MRGLVSQHLVTIGAQQWHTVGALDRGAASSGSRIFRESNSEGSSDSSGDYRNRALSERDFFFASQRLHRFLGLLCVVPWANSSQAQPHCSRRFATGVMARVISASSIGALGRVASLRHPEDFIAESFGRLVAPSLLPRQISRAKPSRWCARV